MTTGTGGRAPLDYIFKKFKNIGDPLGRGSGEGCSFDLCSLLLSFLLVLLGS